MHFLLHPLIGPPDLTVDPKIEAYSMLIYGWLEFIDYSIALDAPVDRNIMCISKRENRLIIKTGLKNTAFPSILFEYSISHMQL